MRNSTVSRKETPQAKRLPLAPRTRRRALGPTTQNINLPKKNERNTQRETSVSDATRRDTRPKTASQTERSMQNIRRKRHRLPAPVPMPQPPQRERKERSPKSKKQRTRRRIFPKATRRL